MDLFPGLALHLGVFAIVTVLHYTGNKAVATNLSHLWLLANITWFFGNLARDTIMHSSLRPCAVATQRLMRRTIYRRR